MNLIEKLALNAQKAREAAKKVGLLPEGNWKWALRQLRGKSGRELSDTKKKIGSIPNNSLQGLDSISRRYGNKEIGAILTDKDKTIKAFNPGAPKFIRSSQRKSKLFQKIRSQANELMQKEKNNEAARKILNNDQFDKYKGKDVLDTSNRKSKVKSQWQKLKEFGAHGERNNLQGIIHKNVILGESDNIDPKLMRKNFNNINHSIHTHPGGNKFLTKNILRKKYDAETARIGNTVLNSSPSGTSTINEYRPIADMSSISVLRKAKHSIYSPETKVEGIHKFIRKKQGNRLRSVYLDRAPRNALEKKAELNKDVKLYPHQQRVVDNPATSQIIAHSVGSGKTLTSIAKFERMKQDGKARKALVIVPAGLRDNFGHSNVKKFTNSKYNIVGTQQEIKKRTHMGIDPSADYNIMSYEIFKRNPDKYIRESGADTVIADESHRGKNEDTKLTKSLKRARRLYANHIGLTGSIVSNSLADIHPLVDVTSGGNHTLGKNKKEFEKRYVRRSTERRYRDLAEKRRPVVGFKNENELKRNLRDNIDYADFEDIKDIANMPGKNLRVRKVPLNSEQVKAYKRILNKHPGIMKLIKMKRLETLKDEEAAKAFSGLIEARKLMNSIGSVKPGMSTAESAEATPKTKKLLDDLTQHLGSRRDAKALLFSHLITGGVDTLEAGLKQRHIPYGRFIGKGNPGSTEEIRQQDVNDYNKGLKKVMLVSSAGGEGLSLDDTTWEGVLDPHYNPEKMTQMEARGIRSGGLAKLAPVDRHVQVNRYLATMPSFLGIFKSSIKTPDEFIYEIASHKDAQNQRLFKLLKDVQSKKRYAPPKRGDVIHSSTVIPQPRSDYSV